MLTYSSYLNVVMRKSYEKLPITWGINNISNIPDSFGYSDALLQLKMFNIIFKLTDIRYSYSPIPAFINFPIGVS